MVPRNLLVVNTLRASAPVGFGARVTLSNGSDISIPDGTGFYRHRPITISSAPSGATVTLAPGNTALWKYRAIYLDGDQGFGQRSDVVSIAVTG